MRRDGTLDLDATARHTEALIARGIAGLIFWGSLGENQMLRGEGKRLVMAETVKAVLARPRLALAAADLPHSTGKWIGTGGRPHLACPRREVNTTTSRRRAEPWRVAPRPSG